MCVCVCVCVCDMHVCVSLPVKKGDRRHACLFHLDSFEITFGGASPREQRIISGYRHTWKIDLGAIGETYVLRGDSQWSYKDWATPFKVQLSWRNFARGRMYHTWAYYMHLLLLWMATSLQLYNGLKPVYTNLPNVQLGNLDNNEPTYTDSYKSWLFLAHSTFLKLPYYSQLSFFYFKVVYFSFIPAIRYVTRDTTFNTAFLWLDTTLKL